MTSHRRTQVSKDGIQTPDGFIQRGSFEWYLHPDGGGSFVKSLAHCIQRADDINIERLRRAFPQMVAAFEMHSWFKAPPGFEPRYNAEVPEEKA